VKKKNIIDYFRVKIFLYNLAVIKGWIKDSCSLKIQEIKPWTKAIKLDMDIIAKYLTFKNAK
jgi:hypothetical protein